MGKNLEDQMRKYEEDLKRRTNQSLEDSESTISGPGIKIATGVAAGILGVLLNYWLLDVDLPEDTSTTEVHVQKSKYGLPQMIAENFQYPIITDGKHLYAIMYGDRGLRAAARSDDENFGFIAYVPEGRSIFHKDPFLPLDPKFNSEDNIRMNKTVEEMSLLLVNDPDSQDNLWKSMREKYYPSPSDSISDVLRVKEAYHHNASSGAPVNLGNYTVIIDREDKLSLMQNNDEFSAVYTVNLDGSDSFLSNLDGVMQLKGLYGERGIIDDPRVITVGFYAAVKSIVEQLPGITADTLKVSPNIN